MNERDEKKKKKNYMKTPIFKFEQNSIPKTPSDMNVVLNVPVPTMSDQRGVDEAHGAANNR